MESIYEDESVKLADIQLNDRELAYIKEKESVTVAVPADWHPFYIKQRMNESATSSLLYMTQVIEGNLENHIEKDFESLNVVGGLYKSAALQNKLSSAKDSRLRIDPAHKGMYELLMQPGQIPNQDFSLHFNTWENIRDLGREMCRGTRAEEASAKLDEMQRRELELYGND